MRRKVMIFEGIYMGIIHKNNGKNQCPVLRLMENKGKTHIKK
jgi:hypothetical protein